MMVLGMPLPTDAVREGKTDHDLVPPEPADQAEMPPMGLKDVRLVVEARLRSGGARPDPPAVSQADHPLRGLPTPDRLRCAPRKGAQVTGWSADHRVDRDMLEVEGPDLVTIEVSEGVLKSGGWDARSDGEPVDRHQPLPVAASDVSTESFGV
jgi:hypothetical protein